MDAQEATQIILDHINIDTEQYRMGHTKVDVLLICTWYANNKLLNINAFDVSVKNFYVH